VLSRWLVIAIICMISILWATNVVVGMIDPVRAVDGLNTIFGAIVGGGVGGRPAGGAQPGSAARTRSEPYASPRRPR